MSYGSLSVTAFIYTLEPYANIRVYLDVNTSASISSSYMYGDMMCDRGNLHLGCLNIYETSGGLCSPKDEQR